MNKPIVPGCKVVVVNSRNGNNGLEFIAKRIADHLIASERYWMIDGAIQNINGDYINYVGETQINRIDDNDEAADSLVSWDLVYDTCGFTTPDKKRVEECT